MSSWDHVLYGDKMYTINGSKQQPNG